MKSSTEEIFSIENDVSSIDNIVKAYYEVVSEPKGKPRQWERDNWLHHPKALVVYTGKDENHHSYANAMNLEEFHIDTVANENGFWESEIHRRTEQFGNIAHVWSTYETRQEENSPVLRRGISIQLYNDGKRWWIISWIFDGERFDNLIPEKYLSAKKFSLPKIK
jgi:hypothetical protein